MMKLHDSVLTGGVIFIRFLIVIFSLLCYETR